MDESPSRLLCIGVDTDTCEALAALGWLVQPAAADFAYFILYLIIVSN
jgi:hypothetical protein